MSNNFATYGTKLAEAVDPGYFVYQSSADECSLIDAGTQAACTKTLPMGVTTQSGAAGDVVAIQNKGLVAVVAGGTIAVGDVIIPKTGAGTGIAFATTGLSNNDVIYTSGVAVSAASSGGIFYMELNINRQYYGA